MKTKAISQTIVVDEDRRVLLLDTPGRGCYGLYKAPRVGTDDWCVYIETNGDPIMLPHYLDADGDQLMVAAMSDAGITLDQVEAAIGCSWQQWCD